MAYLFAAIDNCVCALSEHGFPYWHAFNQHETKAKGEEENGLRNWFYAPQIEQQQNMENMKQH